MAAMEEIGVGGWERLNGEPTRWHERFEVYRSLGPERTVAQAHRIYAGRMGWRGKGANTAWYRAARRWGWRERAAMWDDAERRRLRLDEQAMRTRAYYERVEMITQVLRSALKVFAAAGLDNLSQTEARKLIPAIRPLFREMLNAYRAEVGTPENAAGTGKDADGARPFSADEMGKAIAETRELMDMEETRPQEWRIAPGAALGALRDALAHLYPERADVLRVAEEAGLDVRRIDASGSPLVAWEAVMREARHAGKLDAVLEVASREYDSYSLLRDARAAWARDDGHEGGGHEGGRHDAGGRRRRGRSRSRGRDPDRGRERMP